MTGEDLLKMSDDIETYLAGYDELLGRVENREHLRRFARGQLGPIERKSLEPIADAEADAVQDIFARKIEGIMTRAQIRLLAERKAEEIAVTGERNRRSRESATRRRRELRALGVRLSELPACA